jgi:DNA-binding phage protein
MKTKQKSLQKLTISECKISELLKLKKITNSDIRDLTEAESMLLNQVLTEKINSLKGEQRDSLLKQIEEITTEETKNQLWESNHNQITWAIATLLQEHNRMPSKSELAEKTGLSRQTIHKHLKEYRIHPLFESQIEQFRFMIPKVLAKVFKYAVNGDVQAAKLFLTVIGTSTSANSITAIQNQNNFIQINGIALSQENIKRLNADQLKVIEEILRTALPNPVTHSIDS